MGVRYCCERTHSHLSIPMSSANDYSKLRGAVERPKGTFDYTAHMEYCKDERNWFKRARGEWPDEHVSQREDTKEGPVPM